MNERILRIMEYNKILEQLQNQAATSLGKDLSASLKPSTELEEVVTLQQETDEAVQVERLNAAIPRGGISDIRGSVKRSVIGGILNTDECLNVADTIYGGRHVKDFLGKIDEDIPILTGLAERITPLRELERKIKSCIDDYGSVMDSASEKLRGIRSSIRTNESRIRDKLDDFTKTKSNMLSDSVVTIRNERYVLPVKQAYRGSVGGIVHDQSASGQTLFMEPKAVVDLNNELQEAKAKEKQEIEQILWQLSSQIAEAESLLLENTDVLSKIDFIFARAKLAGSMKASMPQINDRGIIKMKQARHPLIPSEEVVSNDIEIGESYTSIVITGPNTGGKTVALKLVGLCTLMAQSGLQIPALDGCELAVFKNVFADIGDEQSIEQSLSTFSSHMTNIVKIMEQVDDQTLVLFDELGAGTDPQEGAALAMAILDEVISRNARVIATTHYPELKAYGYNRDRVMNASVEFNIQTLQPTYRLLIGVPGRSNAFEISSRLGLHDSIIDHAKELIGVDSKSVENMIASLDDSRKQAEQDYETAHQTLHDAEELKNDLQRKWQQFEDKREKLYQKAEEKANKELQKAREEAELIIEEVRSMKNGANVKEHEWIEAKKMLEEAKPELTSKPAERGQESQKRDAKKELDSGDHIKLLSLNQEGTILEKASDNEYLVQVGIMKVKVKRSDIQFLGKQKEPDNKQVATVKGTAHHVKPELDLRGERYEEAVHKLEKYLDDVLLAGYAKVSIIHGKGTGALRSGVNNFVKNHPHIKSSRSGGEREGGSGVTVIELK